MKARMRDLMKDQMKDLMKAQMRDLMKDQMKDLTKAQRRALMRAQKRDRMRNNMKVMVIWRKYFEMDPLTSDLWMGFEHFGQPKIIIDCFCMSTIANNCSTNYEFDIEIKIEF